MTLKPFHCTGFFLYPLKISGNICFSDVFPEVLNKISVIKWIKDISNIPADIYMFEVNNRNIRTKNKGQNMFKVNNKDTRTMPKYVQS